MFKFDLQLFATTTITTNMVQKAWAKDLMKEAAKEDFFAKFKGTTSGAIIQVKTELKKDKGDKITIPLVMQLTGNGISGDSTLEGNEEKLTFMDMAVTVNQIRNAVRLEGNMEEQKTALNLRSAAKDALKEWLVEKIQKDTFAALTGTPTTNRIVYGGSATSVGALTTTDTFTANLISVARRKALKASPKFKPVKVDGKEYFVMIIDSYQARDLKNDAKWLDAQKFAANRGSDNPIFTGMLGIYDGVVLHEHDDVVATLDGASGIRVGHALLLGCQAGIEGIAQETSWHEKGFDYDNQVGFSTGMIYGIAKSVFTPSGGAAADFATIQVATAAIAD